MLVSRVLVTAAAATLLGCTATPSDGIFDVDGSDELAGTDDSGSSGDGVVPISTSGSGTTATTTTSTSTSTTGPAGGGECPEVLQSYTCPDDFTFSSADGLARCELTDLALPNAQGLFAYCGFLDTGLLGFGWHLAGAGGYECPLGARYAPNDTIGYCLWEELELPVGATEACDELLTAGRLGFSWPCP